MITVKLTKGPGRLCLGVDGHAGAGVWGKDIVCAAVSILTYTAAARTRQLCRDGYLQEKPYIRLTPGRARIIMENCSQTRQLLDVVSTGFDLLALRYPQYVQCKRKELL